MSVRLRKEGKTLLPQLNPRPFLSHKREDAPDVGILKHELAIRGVSSWKDTEDLPLGTETPSRIRTAIWSETAGFMWYGTRMALSSQVICRLEVPEALARASSDPSYPVVPLFVDLRPTRDRNDIAAAMGPIAQRLLDRNGLVRDPVEAPADFCSRAASRYVHDAIAALKDGPVGLSISCFRQPPNRALSVDWRAIVTNTAHAMARDEAQIKALLREIAAHLLERFNAPELVIDADLPLPLGVILGFEWRITTRLQLSVRQRTGVSDTVVPGDGPTEVPVIQRRSVELDGSGPVVLAVSCKDEIGDPAERYSRTVGARSLTRMHVPGLLRPSEVRGLARACADVLRATASSGAPKHLVIRGPLSLAVLIGAAANAVGSIHVPYWDGAGYSSRVVVG